MSDAPQPLTAAMDNVLASKLGAIAVMAVNRKQKVGDSIDQGLILRRLLEEGGFEIRHIGKPPRPSTGLTLKKLFECKLLLDKPEILDNWDVNAARRAYLKNLGVHRNFVYSEKQLAALKRNMLEQIARALYRHHRGLSKFLRREYIK